jgi:hypothetical protein
VGINVLVLREIMLKNKNTFEITNSVFHITGKAKYIERPSSFSHSRRIVAQEIQHT